MSERTYKALECDHMRPVIVMQDGKRFHVDGGFVLAGQECESGAYYVTATYTGDHPVSKLVEHRVN